MNRNYFGKTIIFFGFLFLSTILFTEGADLTSSESWNQLYGAIYSRGCEGEWHKVDEMEAWDKECDVNELITMLRYAAEANGQKRLVEIEEMAFAERMKVASEAFEARKKLREAIAATNEIHKKLAELSKKHAELLATVARASSRKK